MISNPEKSVRIAVIISFIVDIIFFLFITGFIAQLTSSRNMIIAIPIALFGIVSSYLKSCLILIFVNISENVKALKQKYAADEPPTYPNQYPNPYPYQYPDPNPNQYPSQYPNQYYDPAAYPPPPVPPQYTK